MRLFIDWKGKRFEVVVSDKPTTNEVLEAVAKQQGWDKDQLRLDYQKRLLIANESLSTLGITNGSMLNLIVFKIPLKSAALQDSPNEVDLEYQLPTESKNRGKANYYITESKVASLVSMGYKENEAKMALYMAKGVIQIATGFLPMSSEEIKSIPVSELAAEEEVKVVKPIELPKAPSEVSVARREVQQRNGFGGVEPPTQRLNRDGNIPDDAKDEALRDQLFKFFSNTKKTEALIALLQEEIPTYKRMQSTEELLQDIMERTIASKKVVRHLDPRSKQAFKTYRQRGLTNLEIIQQFDNLKAGPDLRAIGGMMPNSETQAPDQYYKVGKVEEIPESPPIMPISKPIPEEIKTQNAINPGVQPEEKEDDSDSSGEALSSDGDKQEAAVVSKESATEVKKLPPRGGFKFAKS